MSLHAGTGKKLFAQLLGLEVCLLMIWPMNRLINYCNGTRDYMVPAVWGQVRRSTIRAVLELTMPKQVDRREDPYTPQQSGGCCTVM